jgi:hypothetical protein
MPITPDDLKRELDEIHNMSLEERMKKFPGEFCSCGNKLEETPGERYFMVVNGKRTQVCGDTYYEALGEEIDKHPIYTPGIRGPGC